MNTARRGPHAAAPPTSSRVHSQAAAGNRTNVMLSLSRYNQAIRRNDAVVYALMGLAAASALYFSL